MLVIKIELWPGGVAARARNMGTMFICNVGGTKQSGNYEVMLAKWGKPTVPWRVGVVRGFPRLSGSPWDLMKRAIVAASDHRNIDQALKARMVSVARRAVQNQPSMFDLEEESDEQFGNLAIEDVDT